MNPSEKYPESGILEDYCLGLLTENEAAAITATLIQDPSLLQRIIEIENALVKYGSVQPRATLKEQLLDTLDTTSSSAGIDLDDLPPIHRNSNALEWNECLKGIEPDKIFGDLRVRFLKESNDYELCLAWLTTELSETEHHADEFAESFLILEGSCECNIGGQLIYLKAGDYLDIPIDTPHTIRSTSTQPGYVKALIQRRKPAA